MDKLTLQHLAPYLPYEPSMQVMREDGSADNITLNPSKIILIVNGYYCGTEKLILRPLSELTKEIEHNGEGFVPAEYLTAQYGSYSTVCEWIYLYRRGVKDISEAPYVVLKKLFEWHFDVFGLIESGLAIDINSIEGK